MIHDLIRVHYRLGFTRLLLDLDLAIAALIAIDAVVYLRLGLSVEPAMASSLPHPFPLAFPVSGFVILLLLVLPASLAAAKVASLPGISRVNPSTRPQGVMLLHILACMLFAFCAVFAARLEVVSGWKEDNGRFSPEYHSIFLSLVMSPLIIKSIASIASLVFLATAGRIGYLILGGKGTKALHQYATRAKLADLATTLRPSGSLLRQTMTATEARNSIPITNTLTSEMVRHYFQELNLRSERIRYAEALLEAAGNLMRECLVERPARGQPNGKWKVEGPGIFLDPGAGWEAALRRSPAAGTVIIGPFCSPHITATIEACCWMANATAVRIPYRPADAYSGWQAHEDSILSELRTRISPGSDVTVVISHVCYATGMKVPLRRFAGKVRREFDSTRIHVMIDGTSGAGNRCRISPEDDWDSYVFYPHRWLLARRPCAAVLVRSSAENNQCFDGALADRRSCYDEMFHTIAGVRAALEVVQMKGLDFFWQRCEALREAFISDLPRSLRTVGPASGDESTFIVSCYPSGSHAWRRSVRAMDDLVGNICGSASFLTIDKDRPWMRLAVPFYMDPRELNHINAFLNDNVSD